MFKFERFNRFFTEFERFKCVYERWTVQQVVNFSNGSTVFLLILNGSSVKKNKKIFERFRGQDFWSFLNGSTHEYRFNPCTEIDLKGSSDFFFFKKGVRFTLKPFNFTLFTPWTLQNITKIWHSAGDIIIEFRMQTGISQ